jgi:hypothetical protein
MILALLIIAVSCSGCALFAAGFIGAEVEKQHALWCQNHPMESNCWQYTQTVWGSHARAKHP